MTSRRDVQMKGAVLLLVLALISPVFASGQVETGRRDVRASRPGGFCLKDVTVREITPMRASNGRMELSGTLTKVRAGDAAGPESAPQEADLPRAAFALGQNFPNPFNPQTVIEISVPECGGEAANLTVYDLRGRLVDTLVNGFLAPGRYRLVWDGRSGRGEHVSSGVYFYRLTVAGRSETRRMILAK